MAYIDINSVSKLYQQVSGRASLAVQSITCSIERGEKICIVGRTGCGKSTLMSLLMGLESPTSGTITINGRSPNTYFQENRGRMAAVFQTDRLLPWRTVIENTGIGLEVLRVPKPERLRRSREWLSSLQIADFEKSFPHELSGGMRQRVALARAFVVSPELLMLDEAFGHLDEVTAADLRGVFGGLLASDSSGENKTVILVTHSIEEAIEVSDRILIIGRPATILRDIRLGDPSERKKQAIALRAEIADTIAGKGTDPTTEHRDQSKDQPSLSENIVVATKQLGEADGE